MRTQLFIPGTKYTKTNDYGRNYQVPGSRQRHCDKNASCLRTAVEKLLETFML